MSDEETTTGVQLAKRVSNKNPLVSEEVPAAMLLSMYLVIITMVAIASRTVPQEERREGMTYSNLAILRLKKKEKV